MTTPLVAPASTIRPTDAVGGVCTGGLDGDFTVTSDGAAVFRLRLSVPPGRNGLQPELALQYDSRSDHGLMGVGWSLTGLPAITRCQKRYSIDGRVAPVRFDASDEFCLDGQRLVAVAGDSPGADGAEYRTRRESFARIRIQGADDQGPLAFEVRRKNGQILTFEPDPLLKRRIEVVPDGDGLEDVQIRQTDVRYSWSLRRIEDRSGNTLVVDYGWVVGPPSSALVGEFLPQQIRYTGHADPRLGLEPLKSVRFFYGAHAEPSVSYVAGLEIRQAARLERIEMWGPLRTQPELLRLYEIIYLTSKLSQRSLVRTIRECDGWPTLPAEEGGPVGPVPHGVKPGACKMPLVCDWEAGSNAFQDMNESQPGVLFDSSDVRGLKGRLLPADLDGDGCDDLVCMVPGADGRDHCAVLMSDGVRLSPLPFTSFSARRGAELPRPIDFDMDGRVELLMYDDSARAPSLHKTVLNRVTVDPITKAVSLEPLLSFPPGQYEVADLVGNRLADMILPWDAGSYWRNTSYGFFEGPQPLPVPPLGDPRVNGHHLILDVDGDGAMEVLCPRFSTPPSGGLLPIPPQPHGLRYNAVGYGKPVAEVNLFSDRHYVFADINGDGLVDAIEVRTDQLGPPSLNIWFNTGNGFVFGRTQAFGAVDLRTAAVRVIGFSQDGRQQLLVRPMTGLMDDPMYVLRWNGAELVEIPLGVRTLWTSDDAFPVMEVLDIDGEGLDDFVMMNNERHARGWTGDAVDTEMDPKLHLYRRQGRKADLLIGLQDPLGRRRTIRYEPLTNPSVYADTQPCAYPIYPVRAKRWVVAATTDSDGRGGVNRLRYRYEDGRADLLGEGFLGFVAREVFDPSSGVLIRSTYNLTTVEAGLYPLASLPIETVTHVPLVSGGERVRSVQVGFEMRTDPTGQAVFTFAQSIHELEQDVVGGTQIVRDVTTTQDFDGYGNLTKRDVLWADGSSETYRASYAADPADWLISLVELETIVSTDSRGRWGRRRVGYAHDGAGQLTLNVIEPGAKVMGVYQPLGPQPDGAQSLFTAYSHNSEGTIARIDQSASLAPAATRRSTLFAYDDVERMYPVSTTNALGQSTQAAFISGLGVRAVLEDPNGLRETYQYDRFGRVVDIRWPSGEALSVSYADQPSQPLPANVPDVAVSSWVRTGLASGPQIELAYDVLGRPILDLVRARDDGQSVLRRTEYGERGRIAKLSEPHFPADQPRWSAMDYDALGRLTSLRRAFGGKETYSYEGSSVWMENGRGRTSRIDLDPHGRVVRQEEPSGPGLSAVMTYDYGPFDVLEVVTDPAGVPTRMHYDRMGRPIRILDANAGDHRFSYTAFGELKSAVRSGEAVAFGYDALGRLSSIAAPEGLSLYSWDTAAHGVGQPASSQSPDGVSINYGYDGRGRPQSMLWTVGGRHYRLAVQYDSMGRLSAISYPHAGGKPFIVGYEYGWYGDLKRVVDEAGNPYWTMVSADASGRFGQEALGNGAIGERTESALHPGLPDGLRAFDANGSAVLDLALRFDANLNVVRRTDNVLKAREACTYDDLDRMVVWDRASAAGPLGASWTYNNAGDIASVTRSNGPSLTYVYGGSGGVGPNAVAATGLGKYAYNAHGEQLSGPGRKKLTYGWFGLPRSLDTGADTLAFEYDAELQRVRYVAAGSEVVSLAGLYEQRAKAGVQRFLVRVGGRPVAQVERTPGGQDTRTYLHLDHLGSLQATTDDAGQLGAQVRYDQFGMRIDPAHPQGPAPAASTGVTVGFTGHDESFAANLIDMSGRWYDPVVGRFLSPDPLKVHPGPSQAQNAYSYVMNNPLSWRDPSGFAAEDQFIGLVNRYLAQHTDDSWSTLDAAVDWAHQQMTAAGSVPNDSGWGAAGIADLPGRAGTGTSFGSLGGVLVADARTPRPTDFISRTRQAMSDAGSGIRGGLYDFERKYGDVPGWKWGLGAAGASALILAPFVSWGAAAGGGATGTRLLLARAGLPLSGGAIAAPRIASDPRAENMLLHMLKHLQGLAPPNASYFYAWVSRLPLLQAAEEFPAYPSRGNLVRIVVSPDIVGWDRITQAPTYYYTVVTTMLGEFISMYPGLGAIKGP